MQNYFRRKGTFLLFPLLIMGMTALAGCQHGDQQPESNANTAPPARTKTQQSDTNEPHPGKREQGGGK